MINFKSKSQILSDYFNDENKNPFIKVDKLNLYFRDTRIKLDTKKLNMTRIYLSFNCDPIK